ncbi:UNVERIFIED_CONTAM: Retrovirus-related Pol polyprotein from transposon TNT 1-94 [Sesamum angustifolium]|uniref:Retrovirus-related Pol polyprotein from transposon TNT 1-94 n=1 Tax=Sesamum angustifolium TaxID=2727405 RepID=A0AAW2M6X4_9LAMI
MLTKVLQLMKGKQSIDNDSGHFASMGEYAGTCLNNTSTSLGLHTWIIDSGATAHMCCDAQFFHDLKPLSNTSSVSLPDDSKQAVTHWQSHAFRHITLTHVLHVPHFKYNLLSVNRLSSSSHIDFIFSSSHCLLQDQRTKRILAVGKLIGKLYTLDRDSFNTDVISRHSITTVAECLLNITVTETDLWHRRLGHTPILVMKRANVLKANTDDLSICQTCLLAKQQRLPFLITEIHSKHVFELIHVDIWGYLLQFYNGNHHMRCCTTNLDSSVLKVFGCLAFATNLQPHKSKFAKRAHRCIFVGYAPGQKGYKLFDLDDNVMLISRDVVFHEQVFPLKNSHATADSGSMPIPDPLPEDSYISTPTTNEVLASMVSPGPTSSDTSASSPVHTDSSSPVHTLRRSTRVVTKPSWLSDFVCSATSPSSSSFLVALVGPSHYAFTTSLSTLIEPKNYAEANTTNEWRLAMKAELAALEDNNTWEVVHLPQGTNAIGCRWVYKLKLRADGSVDRYKARVVAKGYSQVEGIDYNECFSPVAKVVTVRLFLAISAIFNWHIHQLDVNNAFLHGYLDEDIFMEAPEGFHVPTGHSKHDYCLFTKHSGSDFLVLLLYVDDILLAGSSTDMITEVKQLSQFLQSPCQQHWDAALHLVRYLKGSLKKGLFYSAHSPLTLKAYSDTDWASCVDSRRSLTGYCIFLGGSLVSWKTKKQNTVSRSMAEAEYRSMGTTVCELTWIVYLLRDFGVQIPTPIPFLCDNQASLHIVANLVFHERTKHLEIDCYLVRDKFREGLIAPSHVSSRDQLADIFTKPLVGPLFLSLLSKLALIDLLQIQLARGLLELMVLRSRASRIVKFQSVKSDISHLESLRLVTIHRVAFVINAFISGFDIWVC